MWTWRSDRRWTVFGLWLAIGAISLLWFGGIGRAGLGHAYYSGSARTLAHNPQWIFSGAFDPGGFVTVDKPPVGLWPTAVGVRIFGANAAGFVLPSAVMAWGIAALVASTVGKGARGLVAMLVMLTTPALSVLARSSLPDATMLAAGCAAAVVFLRRGPQADLVAGGLLGVALLAKPGGVLMVPAFVVFAAVSPRFGWEGIARVGGVLAAVLLLWLATASFTPDRPFFGGTNSDTAIELLVGPASIDRVVDADLTDGDRWIGLASAGEPGVLRTVTGRMGLQAGFLVFFASASGVIVLRDGGRLNREVTAFWLTWLATHVLVYSLLPGIAHAYYAASLVPPIATLTVMGLDHARSNPSWILLVGLGASIVTTVVLGVDTLGLGVTEIAFIGSAGVVLGFFGALSNAVDVTLSWTP